MIIRRSLLLGGAAALARPAIAKAGLLLAPTSASAPPPSATGFSTVAPRATLSGTNNTIATFNLDNGTWNVVLSNTSKDSGKYHVEFTITTLVQFVGFGIGNSTTTLTVRAGTTGTVASGWYVSGTDLNNDVNGAAGFWSQATPTGTVFAVEMDLTAHKIWIKNVTLGTGWTAPGGALTGDPVAGTNSVTYPTTLTTGVFLFGQAFSNVSNVLTMNPGPTFALTPSAGYSSWD